MKTFLITAILACTVQVILAQGVHEKNTDTISKYDSNGNLYSTAQMQNGKVHGLYTLYYSNGVVKETRMYSNGILNGECYRYSTTGDIIATAEYSNNIKSGVWTIYNQNEKQKITFMYEAGKKVGVSYKYDEQGKIVASKMF